MARRLFRRRMPRHQPPQYSSPDYSSLPGEIQEQILLKLQCFKSILTCTSVCKSWHALIKSRGFIAMHLSRPQSNAEYFLCSYFELFSHSILCYNSLRLESYRDLIFPVRWVKVLGSCHGLICYTNLDDVFSQIYLWNPTIRKLKILPKSKYFSKWAAYGFWYDTISDDYKVAKIPCTGVFGVEVYSLSGNSWDLIATSGPSYSKTYFDKVLHVNGTLYWLASDEKYWWDSRKNWRIISLNMKNLMFRDTLLWPVEKSRSGVKFDMLGAGSRVILLFSFINNSGTDQMGIHVYDENLKELYRYESGSSEKEFLRPLGVRNSGNEVLLQKLGTDAPIVVFDVGELKFKEFCSSTKTIVRAIPFVETLVLLGNGDSRSLPNAR
ncbi:hypothetical protein DCAR_0935005 [Daucus carota subsp. sativus]|uniref:Uncharacterized protein n=1 Tax=Daucus carota subsp. sativus TaxID=79200 RepID=A0A175YH68_DAUCS|nr:PREDICTED: F-box/kelch-repeat protein At3g23880-like [Daucus carota subsp. sativus]WOH15464.1 hypothetical protein DCAR_0935005 [Daucus carota subsp. sativus]